MQSKRKQNMYMRVFLKIIRFLAIFKILHNYGIQIEITSI